MSRDKEIEELSRELVHWWAEIYGSDWINAEHHRDQVLAKAESLDIRQEVYEAASALIAN